MGSMQVKQKRDQYRPKVRTSRNYCLQPASHAILEPGSLKRPEPERGIETRLIMICIPTSGRLKRPEPGRGTGRTRGQNWENACAFLKRPGGGRAGGKHTARDQGVRS